MAKKRDTVRKFFDFFLSTFLSFSAVSCRRHFRRTGARTTGDGRTRKNAAWRKRMSTKAGKKREDGKKIPGHDQKRRERCATRTPAHREPRRLPGNIVYCLLIRFRVTFFPRPQRGPVISSVPFYTAIAALTGSKVRRHACVIVVRSSRPRAHLSWCVRFCGRPDPDPRVTVPENPFGTPADRHCCSVLGNWRTCSSFHSVWSGRVGGRATDEANKPFYAFVCFQSARMFSIGFDESEDPVRRGNRERCPVTNSGRRPGKTGREMITEQT